MQLIKSIALVAVLAVCFVHATILSESVSLLEAHVKDAETLASKKTAFVRMVGAYNLRQELIRYAVLAFITSNGYSHMCSTTNPFVNIPFAFLRPLLPPKRQGVLDSARSPPSW